jgi:hypothetical protein
MPLRFVAVTREQLGLPMTASERKARWESLKPPNRWRIVWRDLHGVERHQDVPTIDEAFRWKERFDGTIEPLSD